TCALPICPRAYVQRHPGELEPLLAALARRGVEFAWVTLHVGAGTFQPVRVKNLAKHRMHGERYEIPEATVAALEAAKGRGGRIVAVGTTTVRCLEASAAARGMPFAGTAQTELFLTPAFDCRVLDRLITNFRRPKSTLVVLGMRRWTTRKSQPGVMKRTVSAVPAN